MPWRSGDRLASQSGRCLLGYVALCLGYVIAGRLGLYLAVPPGYATAIFPPAGIAMAAAFIGGRNTLPWIFVGSWLLNLWIGHLASQHTDLLAVFAACGIAAASVVQAAAGGWALRRLLGWPAPLDNARDLVRFLAGTPLLCLISATLSLTFLTAIGAVAASDFASSWFTWWIGDTLGVLMFLPLVLVVAGEPRSLWRARAWSAALPMLLFFALFVAIFVRTKDWERSQSLLEFQLLSQGFGDTLRSQLAAQEDFLEQLAVSWSGPAPLSRADFAALTAQLRRRFSSIQAIEWAPRITRDERAGFEAAQQRDDPLFAIRERDAVGELVRAGEWDSYYPVTYVEPRQGNEAAVGFDLISDTVRRDAVVQAVARHSVIATAPISLVQAPNDRTGILLALAVPRGANGPGVLLAVVRMDQFVDALLGSVRNSVDVRLIDRSANQNVLDSIPAAVAPLYRKTITFGGRIYVVNTAPTPFYYARHRSWQSWAVLIAGVLSTTLLGALLLITTGERQRIARLLSERTRERDQIWQVSEDLLGISNFAGYFISVNPAWNRTLGWSEDEIRSLHVNQLRHPDDIAVSEEGRRRLAEGAGTVRMENRYRHKDGSYRWIYWTLTAEQGLIYASGRDVTADREAALALQQTEAQLRQLQKMDSVGQLTGGIAHDFNNLLTVIIGNLEMLDRWLEPEAGRVRKAVSAAINGATRAATLTQRLLAYAQRQPLRPRTVDLNELVTGMRDLMRRTQGETIEFEFALSAEKPACFCDANQLETALLNLVINARDAMPHGGRLVIETANVAFDASGARVRGVTAGPYVMLAVSDSGTGMPRATVERAFEPFFTTKGIGKGTGLGLSMAYGFVKQSNGHIEIDSEPGKGTTVRMFLPALTTGEQTHGPGTMTAEAVEAHGAGETILVAEDDDGVRGFVVEVLWEMGYRVLEAADAAAALEIIFRVDTHVDLLLTDVIMPGMNGRELANRVRASLPGTRVLFMTGYSQDEIVHQGRLDPEIELIEKPFRREDLASRVRAMLGSAPTTREAAK